MEVKAEIDEVFRFIAYSHAYEQESKIKAARLDELQQKCIEEIANGSAVYPYYWELYLTKVLSYKGQDFVLNNETISLKEQHPYFCQNILEHPRYIEIVKRREEKKEAQRQRKEKALRHKEYLKLQKEFGDCPEE